MNDGLRTRLERLRVERKAYEKLLRLNREEAAATLLEVRETESRALTEAADLLGVGRPTAYALIAQAEEAGL